MKPISREIMDTITDNNETPKRRLEDHLPAETIAWDEPGAPAVLAAPRTQSCAALRHVASMVVNAEGVSVFPTPAAARLEHGHYMLSAPGAQLTTAATPENCATVIKRAAAPGCELLGSEYLPLCDHGCKGAGRSMGRELGGSASDSAAVSVATKPAEPVIPAPRVEELTDAQIDLAWSEMPGGADGWLKQFGYQQFAREIQGRVMARALAVVSGAARPTDDELWDATVRDRDTYHDWADKLAEAISKYFDAYIGEHSNTNCPWAEALEAIGAATIARQAQPADRDAVLDDAVDELRQMIVGTDLTYKRGILHDAIRRIEALKGSGSTQEGAVA